MESEKAVAIEEACRFCWMCRHLCPVALVTGNEANTPRGRALVASMDRRGVPFDKGSAEKMFQCTLCYACTDNCATGYDPTVFTRESRSRALAEGLANTKTKELAEKLLDGEHALVHEKNCKELQKIIETLPEKADVLVYRSGYTKHALPLLELLKKAGIPFTTKEKEPVSGALACDVVGYVEEVKNLASTWAKWVNDSGAKTVVCLDPGDVFFVRDQMAKWDIKVNPVVMTATSYVASLIKEGSYQPKGMKGEVIYHDPSRLCRNLTETEEARYLIMKSGMTVKELFLHGHMARSAGSIILDELYPELQAKVAAGLWEDVKERNGNVVVTASPETLECLEKSAPKGMKAVDIFTLL
jgi:Fe-S oxidoreductase